MKKSKKALFCEFCKESFDDEHFINDAKDVCENEVDSLELVQIPHIDLYVKRGFTSFETMEIVIVDFWEHERVENTKIDYNHMLNSFLQEYNDDMWEWMQED